MKSVTTAMASLLQLAMIQAIMYASVSTGSATGSTNPAIFFSKIEGNLTKIVWAHAVNSQAELDKALGSGDIMMLEADVVLGKLNGTMNDSEIPIMAHPPANESDLSLEHFLKSVIEKNATKGIKLDFKSIEAFTASKTILDKVRNDTKFPVFLNADILPGPVNATAVAVDAKAFLSQAKMYPEWTVSVGWTTRYGAKENITEGRYTEKQVHEMIDALKEQRVSQPITYPVRAGLAANDINAIKSLMEKSSGMSNVTLTVWSSEGDKVDAEQLSTLIKDIGVRKVYVDVPRDLMMRLNLSGASSASVASMTVVQSLLIAVFLTTLL